MKKSLLIRSAYVILLSLSIQAVLPAGCHASENESITDVTDVDSADDRTVNDEYTSSVEKALDLLRNTWQKLADKYPEDMPEPYVDIKNTRIIKIAENPVYANFDNKPAEELNGIDYIIEFLMYTNYFGDTYPVYAGQYDSVAVNKYGMMEVQDRNLLTLIRAKYYISDYTGIIEEITDLENTYNGELF